MDLFKCLRMLRLVLMDNAKLAAMSKAAGIATIAEQLSKDGKSFDGKVKNKMRAEERRLKKSIGDDHGQWDRLRNGFLGLPELVEANEKNTAVGWANGNFGDLGGDDDNADDDDGLAAGGGDREADEEDGMAIAVVEDTTKEYMKTISNLGYLAAHPLPALANNYRHMCNALRSEPHSLRPLFLCASSCGLRRQIVKLRLRRDRAEEEIELRRDRDMLNMEKTLAARTLALEVAVEKLKARASPCVLACRHRHAVLRPRGRRVVDAQQQHGLCFSVRPLRR